MEKVAETVNFFKDPADVARQEEQARHEAIARFIARGGSVKICAPAPTPRRMTANP